LLFESQAANNIEELRRCSNYILLEADSAGGGLSVPEPNLVALTGAFSRVFRGRTLSESVTAVADYKVFICEEENVKKNTYGEKGGHSTPYQLPAGVRVSGGHYSASNNQKKRVLNFWAFSPGIAMEDLKNLGVRTVILTSGTLSPMESFKEDMKLPFPIQLENKHVIQNKQIWVGCITTGMTGKQLNSSFKVRETADYKDEIGGSILNITRTMAGQGGTGSIGAGLPPGPELDGGILVFFPSYGVMDSCVERWRETGLLERLKNVGGAVVIEPKGSGTGAVAGAGAARIKSQGYKKSDRWSDSSTGATVGSKGFGIVSSNVNSKATQKGVVDEEDEGAGGGAGLGGVIKEFEATLASRGRCVLLAVCRYSPHIFLPHYTLSYHILLYIILPCNVQHYKSHSNTPSKLLDTNKLLIIINIDHRSLLVASLHSSVLIICWFISYSFPYYFHFHDLFNVHIHTHIRIHVLLYLDNCSS
jgi:hypothetical protein